jgi:glycosyltransferase involved in cell wall biosynthesis
MDFTSPQGATVIIPAYNEEQAIGTVLERLHTVLSASNWKFEIIVVDDGSTDHTAEIVQAHPARLISHPSNRGYGASLKTGIRNATHDLIVTLDSDGQHDPQDVLRLLEMAKTHEVVIGARIKGSYSPLVRRPGKWILAKAANYLAGMKIPDLNSGLRAFRRQVAQVYFPILPNGFSFATTFTLAALKDNLSVAWVPITVVKRKGTSMVNPITDGYNTLILILRIIVLFDPLKVFMPASLLLGLFGLAFSLYGIIRFGSFPESGVLILVTALLLFFLGILADSISALRRGMKQ